MIKITNNSLIKNLTKIWKEDGLWETIGRTMGFGYYDDIVCNIIKLQIKRYQNKINNTSIIPHQQRQIITTKKKKYKKCSF